MKKLSTFLVIAVLLSTITVGCAKDPYLLPPLQNQSSTIVPPQIMNVSPDGTQAQITYYGQTITMRTVSAPFFNGYNQVPGSVGNILYTNPPVAPLSWYLNQNTGQWVSDGYTFTPGNSAETGTGYIVRRTIQPNGSSTFGIEKVVGTWSQTPNPSTWISVYAPNTKTMPLGWYHIGQASISNEGIWISL